MLQEIKVKTYSAVLTSYAAGRKLQVTGLNLMKRKERKALRQAVAPGIIFPLQALT